MALPYVILPEGPAPEAFADVSIQALLSDASAQVKEMRGKWHNWSDYPIAVSYHPLAVRRRPYLFPAALKDWDGCKED